MKSGTCQTHFSTFNLNIMSTNSYIFLFSVDNNSFGKFDKYFEFNARIATSVSSDHLTYSW